MRKTINLSKARNAGRQHRAKKAVNKLKSSFEGEVKISQELNEVLWNRGATKPPRKIELKVVETTGVTTLYPVEGYDDLETDNNEGDEVEEEPEQAEEETQSSEKIDYNELVDNNVSDVKQAVSSLEAPDFEALLEAEEKNKDRKTLKEWIESQ